MGGGKKREGGEERRIPVIQNRKLLHYSILCWTNYIFRTRLFTLNTVTDRSFPVPKHTEINFFFFHRRNANVLIGCLVGERFELECIRESLF